MITVDNFIAPGDADVYVQVTPEFIAELIAIHGFKRPHTEGDFVFNLPSLMWEEFLGDIDFD